jgi:hypothetical protein
MKYSTEEDFAAVLLARPFLVKHMAEEETFFENWIKSNFARLRQQYADIRKYGLMIVFKTCSAPYCAISTFGGASKTVSAGFSGGAYTPIANAKLSASGKWHLEGRSGAWRSFGQWHSTDYQGGCDKTKLIMVEEEEEENEIEEVHDENEDDGDADDDLEKVSKNKMI